MTDSFDTKEMQENIKKLSMKPDWDKEEIQNIMNQADSYLTEVAAYKYDFLNQATPTPEQYKFNAAELPDNLRKYMNPDDPLFRNAYGIPQLGKQCADCTEHREIDIVCEFCKQRDVIERKHMYRDTTKFVDESFHACPFARTILNNILCSLIF